MKLISRNEFLKQLDDITQEKIILKLSDYIMLEIVLEKFKYEIEDDLICIKSNINNNHIIFNLNDVNCISQEKNKISCNLNNRNRYKNWNNILRKSKNFYFKIKTFSDKICIKNTYFIWEVYVLVSLSYSYKALLIDIFINL